MTDDSIPLGEPNTKTFSRQSKRARTRFLHWLPSIRRLNGKALESDFVSKINRRLDSLAMGVRLTTHSNINIIIQHSQPTRRMILRNVRNE